MKKKDKPAKPISKDEIADLKKFLNRKFSSIDERFSNIENKMEEGFVRLENKLGETEKRLDRRIMEVGDLITIDFSQKHQKLEKRVSRLERTRKAA